MKRLFAFALTALMLMGCFTGCCCCDFGLGDRIEQIVGEEMNEIVEEQVGQLIGGEQFGQLIGGEITLPKNEATEPPDSDQWMPGNELGLVEPGVLTVATNTDFPPYAYTNEYGESCGIDMDIAHALAEKLNLDLVIMDMEFTDALAAVQEGKADVVISGITATEDRMQKMEFSDVYATNTLVIMISERSNIKTVDDLHDSRIGVKENTVESLYCAEDFGYSNVKTYDSYLDAILSLERNRVDCIVLDRAVAEAHGITHSLLSILDEYCVEDYRIGMAKDNDELRDAVNEALSELISDGTVQEIIRSYIRP